MVLKQRKHYSSLSALLLFTTKAILVVGLGLPPVAQAQAFRTYVDGVGDDANPGSHNAPCKTFAGCISKTAAKGEINVLGPGSSTEGFRAITITKGFTIDGAGTMASIHSFNGPCVTVSAAQGDVITLRNLSLNGESRGGTYGVRITAADLVVIENCAIFGGATHAIDFQPTTTNAMLHIRGCRIYNSGGAGVFVNATGGAGRVLIENSSIEHCAQGIRAVAGTVVLINTTVGGCAGLGLDASGGGGSIVTYHNNRISGNNPDGHATGSVPLR